MSIYPTNTIPGLGAMMARALDANGASKVFIVGRRNDSLQQVASTAKNGTIIPVVGDVTSKPSLTSIVSQVYNQVDHIDVLIANAGISGPSGNPPPKSDSSPHTLFELREHLWNTPMEDFTQCQHANVTGVFYSTLAFLPLLEAANTSRLEGSNKPRPQIIATSSIGAFNRIPQAGFAYSASKAAVIHMMKQLSTLLSKYDIRSNVIAPGLYPSELTESGLKKRKIEDPTKEGSFDRSYIPATRTGTEEDIAGVVLWLCSRAGAYVNGNVVVTDGGKLSVSAGGY